MQRPIKFRAWDTVYNQLIHNAQANLGYFLDDDKRWVLMQYTGMPDKNGKEIYESDILRGDHTDPNCMVKFKDGCFGIDSEDGWLDLKQFCHEEEVIGNIHENPELLQ